MNPRTLNKLAIIGLGLCWASSSASADPIHTYSYHGRTEDGANTPVELILAGPIPGRDESYFGFLLREKPARADVFLVDPDTSLSFTDDTPTTADSQELTGHVEFAASSKRFTLTPWKVRKSGELGETNVDASYFLTPQFPALLPNLFAVCANHPFHEKAFRLTSAQTGNREASDVAISFDGSCSNETLIDYLEGGYRQEGVSKSDISFLPLDTQGETTIALSGEGGLNGTYVIRRKQIGLFNFRAELGKGTGTETVLFPSRIGFFLKKSKWFAKEDKFVMVDPTHPEGVAVFVRKTIQTKLR